MPNSAPDIAGHALRHGWVAVGGLKLVMNQRLLAADAHADEAVSTVGFDGGLLGVDHVDHFKVVLVEGEAGEVAGVGVDEMFGDGIEFGHEPCLGPWVAGGVVPATGKNRATAAAQRGGEGYEVLECSGKDTGMEG